MITVRKANERGHVDLGWLDTYHTFSFGDYFDPDWMRFRSLRVINDDRIAPRNGFGMHVHRDMEIITYVLSGSLAHKDLMGNGRVIRPGEFQYMSAGLGVMHSEHNASDSEPVHLLQIWIMPDERGVKPRYAKRPMADAAPGQFHLVASKQGRDGSIDIHQDADLWLARLDAGHKVEHSLAPGRHAWLHVAEGEVRCGDLTLSGGDAIGISEEDNVRLEALKPSQVLLVDLS